MPAALVVFAVVPHDDAVAACGGFVVHAPDSGEVVFVHGDILGVLGAGGFP